MLRDKNKEYSKMFKKIAIFFMQLCQMAFFRNIYNIYGKKAQNRNIRCVFLYQKYSKNLKEIM